MGSISELRITIVHPGVDMHRAEGIIARLSERTAVRALGGAWEVEYTDFEDRADALEALNRDLDAIAGDWRGYLETDHAPTGLQGS
jgi:hypothetical protein